MGVSIVGLQASWEMQVLIRLRAAVMSTLAVIAIGSAVAQATPQAEPGSQAGTTVFTRARWVFRSIVTGHSGLS